MCFQREPYNKPTPVGETQSESNASVLNKHKSTPYTKKVKQKIKNDDDIEKQVVKRRRSSTKSASRTPASPKKRSRISTRDSFTDDPVKDTDPRHPTSSISLRMKGRNHKGFRKLMTMGPLVHYNKYQLDESTTINDCVEGEVLIPLYKKEFYFSISAEPPLTEGDPDDSIGIDDNDERHPTNSRTLRRKGREHKGKKKLKPFPPLLHYSTDTVTENMVDMKDPAVGTKEMFFKLSSRIHSM